MRAACPVGDALSGRLVPGWVGGSQPVVECSRGHPEGGEGLEGQNETLGQSVQLLDEQVCE